MEYLHNSNCCFKIIQFGNVECTLVRENIILFLAVVREKSLISFIKKKSVKVRELFFLTSSINPVCRLCLWMDIEILNILRHPNLTPCSTSTPSLPPSLSPTLEMIRYVIWNSVRISYVSGRFKALAMISLIHRTASLGFCQFFYILTLGQNPLEIHEVIQWFPLPP